MAGRLRVLFAWLALACALAFAPRARADEPVERAPRDVPLLMQPGAIVVPPLPDTDQVRESRLAPGRVPAERARARRAAPPRRRPESKRSSPTRSASPCSRRPSSSASAIAGGHGVARPADVPPPQIASAVTLAPLRLVLLSMRAPFSNEGTDLEELARHELAHVALDDAVAEQHVPRWFNEGFAVNASGERPWERGEALGQATVMRSLIPLANLDRFPRIAAPRSTSPTPSRPTSCASC